MSELTWGEIEALEERVALACEPMPAPISARELRDQQRDFHWANVHYVKSPDGFWRANIGTDHGPPADDDLPVTWEPAEGLCQEIEMAWKVAERWGLIVGPTYNSHPRAPKYHACKGWQPGLEECSADGMTAPLAICYAALELAALAATETGG